MPGSSTTPGRVDARFHAPTRVAFRIRNGVGTRDKNLCEAQWLACVLLYRRFAAALTGDCARLEADVVSYSFIVSDLHRLLVAGLPAHCERILDTTSPLRAVATLVPEVDRFHQVIQHDAGLPWRPWTERPRRATSGALALPWGSGGGLFERR